jgi:hypothetical protein
LLPELDPPFHLETFFFRLFFKNKFNSFQASAKTKEEKSWQLVIVHFDNSARKKEKRKLTNKKK